MMKYTTSILLLLLAASYCSAAPSTSAEDNIHDRVRRNNPTNVWWVPGSTPSTGSSHVSCGHPGTPQSGSSLFESVLAGAIVVHSCDPGHRLEGAKLRLCQSNGQWTPQLPKCVFVDCGDPGEPLNGNRWVGATFLGSIVKYKCNRGFNLVGNNFRVCQDNGQWDGHIPICQPPPCPRLRSPSNGQVTVKGQGSSATARYRCNSGFTLVGSDIRTCVSGIWQGQAPICQAVTCPTLPDIKFGSVIVSSNSVGSVARYVCNTGFDLVGSASRTCQSNGQWSGIEPECKEVSCRVLQDPPNGRVRLSGTSVGSEASYSCDSGFTLVGSRVRVCQADGEWSSEEPFCQVVECGSLSSPLNGRVLLTGTIFESVARYVCDSGFELIGSSKRVCQADGTWSNEAPICRVLGCSNLPDPANGQVFLTGTTPGALATYICDSGFRLEGSRNRVCQVNGEWSAEEPTCVRFSCDRLENPENGQVIVSGLSPGSVAQYRCDPGFELVGVATRICLQSGQWSSDAPFCRASRLEFAFSEVVYEVREGERFAAVVIELISGTVTSTTPITLSTSDLSAVDSVDSFGCFDYTSTSVTVSFPAGTVPSGPGSQRTVNIPINDDNCVERSETFRVTATSTDPDVTFPRGASSTVTIQDNDVTQYRFTEATYTVRENEGPAQPAIELFSDSVLTFPATVRVTDIQGGTATDGVDYTGVSVDVVFPAGSSQGSQVSFNIPIIDDQLVEGDETILLQASTDEPGEVPSQPPGQDRATVVIRDNDVVMCERLLDIANGRVVLSGLTVGSLASYTCNTGFNLVGNSARTCQSNGFWSGVEPFCTPSRLEFAFSEVVYEVREGERFAAVVIELISGTVTSTTPITLSTSDLSAVASVDSFGCFDYTSTSVTVSFPAGTVPSGPGSQRTVNIPINDDNCVERSESFRVTATSTDPDVTFPRGASSTVTIQDNDVAQYRFTEATYTVRENEGPAQLAIELFSDTVLTFPATVRVTDIQGGTATDGVDYTGVFVDVVFPAGSSQGSQVSFNIPIIDDQLVEGDETILLQASTDEPGEVPSQPPGQDRATVVIQDNDVVMCERLLDIANGRVVLSGLTVGSLASYTCNTGFNLVGNSARTCQSNGLWSGVEPFCTPVSCDRLENPQNGRVDISGTQVGAVATYVCFPGFSLVGVRTRRCLPSGQWSGSAPICEAITCPDLDDITNGHVMLSGNTVGSSATYTCARGFGLVGVSPRFCQPNGQWSGEEPSCQPASCPNLRKIANGVIRTTGMQFGDTATYSCLSGFQLVGNEVRTCQANGFWSGTEPFCQAVQCDFLDAPENGQVILRGTVVGSEAVYSCFPGFTLTGGDTRTCQESGVWSGQAPICIAIDCGELQAPRNGQVTLTGTVFNSLAVYSCNDGFTLVGSAARTCMASGQWSGEAPTCVSRRCGLLDPPLNGRVDIAGFTSGSTATYTCLSGFTLVGSSTRTCQPNGVWSGSAPFCQGVTCGVLTAPQNGRVTLTGTQVRDTATYECLPGFVLQGTRVRECQPNGQWSLQEPSCNAIDCGSLSAPENGAVVLSGTTFLSTARYSCDPGFGLVGSIVRNCGANGEWSRSAPVCQIAQCPSLDAPANGNIETTGMNFWDTATYVCDRGFNLVGVAVRTCQANGAWSGNPPFCTPAQCPVLDPPKDGQVQFTSTGFGAVATYSCLGGFSLVGNEQRTCEADGTWSGSAPTCTRIDCGILASPKNGDISFSAGTVYGSVATYTCEPPFQLVGTATRVCLETGQWSGEAPSCESLECPDLSAPENGGVSQSGSIPGATATYVCNTGFSLIGDERRICQTNGFWTGVAPLCQRAECDDLKPPDNGDVQLSGRTIGSHATYSCEEGFELVGNEFRSCQANGEWSGSEPSCEAVNCGLLSNPRNGVVETTGTGVGDTATYRCNNGFVLFGKGIRECREDGTWNGEAPECREVNCGRLNNPINGFVAFTGTTFGLTATYTCDPGFELVGFSSRVCEITGSWSGEEPVCTADVCPTLVAPANGDVVQGANQFGDTAVYSCNPGFTLAGGRIRTCLDGGQWSGSAPTCEGISCRVLQSPENGRVIFLDGTSVGSIARYECNTGFTLSGTPIRSCEEDGNWSGNEPVCEIVQCDGLRDPFNGRVSVTGTDFGSQATYSCFSGFLLVGAEFRTCTADGIWSLSAPVCLEVEEFDCDQLDDPRNGRVRVTGTRPGSVATYGCNSGFNLFGGNENRRCVEGSGWSGEAPTCQPVDCGLLLSPLNGQVLLLQGTVFGASAMYNCDEGFVLLGVTVRRCEANGEWSATEPTCSPVQCVRLRNPLNGQVVFETRTLGSVATYSCEQGFSLDGQAVRICESDGDWSGRAPTCIRTTPTDCGDPGVPLNGRRISDDFRIGATVYYECNEGFQLVGTASRICQNTGLWSGFLPTCAPIGAECTSGSTSVDPCGRQCSCINGRFVDCCRVRVDFASMSDDDKNRLISAIIQAATDPQMKLRYNALVELYKSSFDSLAQNTEPSMSQFLPWNRFFLIQYENLLREVDCRITLPYWDWTALPLNPYMSPVFSPLFGFGDSSRSNDSCVNVGPFNFAVFSITPSAGGGCLQRQYRMQMFPTRAIIEQDLLTLTAADFVQFHQFLQVFIHTNVRCFVGGQMCSSDAANDPAYLLHLAQIDFLFDRWQRISPNHLNARFARDNTSLVLTTGLRVSHFANNNALANDICILYDHPDFKSHVPPPMRFLADALEQMTKNHDLKMECVRDSDMEKVGMGKSEEEFMNKMCHH